MNKTDKNTDECESQTLPNVKTLIVEDDFASCRLLEEYLSRYGDCSTVVNGAEAIEEFEKALISGECYDVICLDIMLPKMNGYQVLKEIRRIEQANGISESDGVKVIMTTAIDYQDDAKRAFKAGCKAYIVKPIRSEALLGEMRKLGVIK